MSSAEYASNIASGTSTALVTPMWGGPIDVHMSTPWRSRSIKPQRCLASGRKLAVGGQCWHRTQFHCRSTEQSMSQTQACKLRHLVMIMMSMTDVESWNSTCGSSRPSTRKWWRYSRLVLSTTKLQPHLPADVADTSCWRRNEWTTKHNCDVLGAALHFHTGHQGSKPCSVAPCMYSAAVDQRPTRSIVFYFSNVEKKWHSLSFPISL